MRNGLLLLLSVLLLGPAAAQPDGDGPAVQIPGVADGDWWEYEIEGKVQGETRTEVMGEETILHGGRQVRALRLEAVTEVPAVAPEAPQMLVKETSVTDKWVRFEDYATVRLDTETTTEGAASDAKRVTRQGYLPPLVDHRFPFDVGSWWLSMSNGTTEEDNERPVGYRVYVNYTVEDHKPALKVKGTEYEVWVIFVERSERYARHAEESRFRQYYAPSACSFVREEELDTDLRTVLTTLNLTGHQCSHTAKETPAYDGSVRLIAEPPGPDATQTTTTSVPNGNSKDSPASGFVAGLLAFLAAAFVAARGSPRRRGR